MLIFRDSINKNKKNRVDSVKAVYNKITKKINVIAPAFSHAAQQAIEACGGTIANVAS